MNQVLAYVRESYHELVNKVTWPSWSSLQSTTIVVLVASIILTLIVFVMDLISKNILDLVYPG